MTNLLKRIFLSIGLVAFLAAPVLAADPRHDYSTSTPLSELTKQELQQWAVYYWQHQETGTWSAEAQAFEFTHPEEMPPGFIRFGVALDLFEDLYQDQLNLDSQSEYYGIDQLINDDEQVRNQFKLYTTTGLLIMGSASAPAAVLHHQMAAIEAMTIGESYEIGQLQYLNQYAVVTVNLRRLPRPTLLIPPVPVPIANEQLPAEIQNFDYWLKQCKNRLKDNHRPSDQRLYYPDDDDHGIPGFDCDDFADAMTVWLHKRFPGASIMVFYMYWYDAEGIQQGHAMIRISKMGYYWVLDPIAGTLLGPFTDGTPVNVSPILEIPSDEGGYGVPVGTPIDIKPELHGPDFRPRGEPPAWWQSEAMRNRFEAITHFKWNWYAWDSVIFMIMGIYQGDPDPDIVTIPL